MRATGGVNDLPHSAVEHPEAAYKINDRLSERDGWPIDGVHTKRIESSIYGPVLARDADGHLIASAWCGRQGWYVSTAGGCHEIYVHTEGDARAILAALTEGE